MGIAGKMRCASVCLCCTYPTPINLDVMLPWLIHYPRYDSALLLKDGFSVGFKLHYGGIRKGREAVNLKSALGNPTAVIEKLNKESKLGRVAGPFSVCPLPDLIVSPVGLVPKAQPGKFRLIQHLSFPPGESINDGIDREACRVTYARFDDAVGLVCQVGKGALMAKADIESAFRLLPIHPSDFQLLGIKVEGQYYVDKALPMGASCSPAFFEHFSTFVEWVVAQEAGTNALCHYMDDFFFVGGPVEGAFHIKHCSELVACFEDICGKFGIPLSKDKAAGPTSKIVFLGLEIDSINQVVSVPAEKVVAISDKITAAVGSSFMTLRGLQSLIGSLSFICRAISPGRAFLRRLIDLTIGLKRPFQKIRLSKGARLDLAMWQTFLARFNRCVLIPDQFWCEDNDLQLFTDASGGIGCGGFLDGKWFQGRWPPEILLMEKSIAWLEFFPIVVAVALWGRLLVGKRILIRSDNEAVVAILNKQSSKCADIMNLVRFFVLQCLKHNVAFKARHIPGIKNNIADALSRFQVPRFWALAPRAERQGAAIPEFLWTI